MPFSFGYQPRSVAVHLTSGSDFNQTLSTADGSDWPAGTSIALKINEVAWPAVIDGPTATWSVDRTAVDALRDDAPLIARVLYSDGDGAELTWMTGSVVWHG